MDLLRLIRVYSEKIGIILSILSTMLLIALVVFLVVTHQYQNTMILMILVVSQLFFFTFVIYIYNKNIKELKYRKAVKDIITGLIDSIKK